MNVNALAKAAAAAVVLAGLNLLAIAGLDLSSDVEILVTTGFVAIAGFFSPRISYLGARYAGAIGSAATTALALLNLLVVSGRLSEPLEAGISALITAVAALFVPSLT